MTQPPQDDDLPFVMRLHGIPSDPVTGQRTLLEEDFKRLLGVAARGATAGRILSRWSKFDAAVMKAQALMREFSFKSLFDAADEIDDARQRIGGQP